jgi:hypothetical protein
MRLDSHLAASTEVPPTHRICKAARMQNLEDLKFPGKPAPNLSGAIALQAKASRFLNAPAVPQKGSQRARLAACAHP